MVVNKKGRVLSEDLFYKVFNLSPLAVAITTIKGSMILQSNEAFTELTGYRRDHVIGKSVVDLGIWVSLDDRKNIINKLREQGYVHNVEIKIRDASGSIHDCLFFCEIVTFENEPHILSMAMDITERKNVEYSLRKAENMYHAMFDNILNGVAVYEAVSGGDDFVFVDFNTTAEEIDNISKADVIGKTLLEVFPSSMEYGLLDALKEVWKTGKPVHFPISLYKDNRIHGWRENFIYKLPSGEVVAVYSDRTAQKKAEEGLQESQRILKTLLGNLPGMAYRCKNIPDWSMEIVSQGSVELTGYSTAELISNRDISYGQLIHPDDRNMVWETIQAAIKEKEHFQIVYRIKTAQGDQKWVWEQGVGVFSSRGDLVALEGFIADITKQKQIQDALRRSEEKFSKAFHSSPDWITITTLKDGFYVDVNEAFLRDTGYGLDEVIGRTSIELDIWKDPEDRARIVRKMTEKSRTRNEEIQFKTKDGRVRDLLWSAEIIQFGGEECILSVCRDITRHKRMESELRQSQKMEAVGQLAGGIAHDFNNILAAISGYSELVLDNINKGKPVKGYLERIIEVENTASLLIRKLMIFSRKQIFEPQVIDLYQVVTNIRDLLDPLLGSKIELEIDLDDDRCLLFADQSQLEQIIMNLAINARDAMPQGGKFRIETKNLHLSQVFTRKHSGLKPGEYIRLKFSDRGEGMDKKTLSRIFEPFFTTKEEGKGTGLGLSTVYGTVKQVGGDIWVHSSPGKGTTFTIFLPRYVEKQEKKTKRKIANTSRKARERMH